MLAEVSLPLPPNTAAKIPQGKEAVKPQSWGEAVCSFWGVLLSIPPPSQHRCPLDKGDSSALNKSLLQQEARLRGCIAGGFKAGAIVSSGSSKNIFIAFAVISHQGSLSSNPGLGATGPDPAPTTLGWALLGETQPRVSWGPVMHFIQGSPLQPTLGVFEQHPPFKTQWAQQLRHPEPRWAPLHPACTGQRTDCSSSLQCAWPGCGCLYLGLVSYAATAMSLAILCPGLCSLTSAMELGGGAGVFPLTVLRAATIRAVGSGEFVVGVCVAKGAVTECPLLFLGLWGKPHSFLAQSSGPSPWPDCHLDLSHHHRHQHYPPALLTDTSKHLAHALHTSC